MDAMSNGPGSAAVALVARNVTKRFGGVTAVDDLNLRVERGAVHGLIGPNGAGKTTVFGLLSKFLQPTDGSIELFGRDITQASAAEVVRLGLVRSFQISATFGRMTVLDNVRVALQRPRHLASQFWRTRRALDALNEEAMSLLERVRLADHGETLAGDLPYGRRRALELVTTLAAAPQLILLDEPVAGIASEEIPETVSLVKDMARDRTVLIVEHNLSVVESLCSYVTVLHRGRILAEGSYLEVAENPLVRKAYLGESP